MIDLGGGIPGGRVKEKEMQSEEEAERPAEDLPNEAEPQAKKEGFNIRKELVEESDPVEKIIRASNDDYADVFQFQWRVPLEDELCIYNTVLIV